MTTYPVRCPKCRWVSRRCARRDTTYGACAQCGAALRRQWSLTFYRTHKRKWCQDLAIEANATLRTIETVHPERRAERLARRAATLIAHYGSVNPNTWGAGCPRRTDIDIAILIYLVDHPGALMRDIAQHIQRTESTVSDYIARLEREGLLTCSAYTAHHRYRKPGTLVVTVQGIEHLTKRG